MITDHPLLKQACFIGGLWAHADDGATNTSTNKLHVLRLLGPARSIIRLRFA